MKIAITGAGGLLGSHLARDLTAEHEVLALTHRDLDITDRAAVTRYCLSERPEVMINCAVIGVDECERNPALADAINVAGPQALAENTAAIGAEFLHFSTNYVYDGEPVGRAPYTIDDETRPINVYGSTKLAGERAVLAASPRSFIIRSSWIYGSGKENFLSTAHRRLLAGERIRAIADVWASTTYVTDLVVRVSEILQHHHYGIYQIVNAGVSSYYDFATEAARLIGLNGAEAARLIERVSEDDAQRVAPRPRYTPMRCLLSEKLGLASMRDWREALRDYVCLDAASK
ncbi:MAG: dTDP-4-dehydrorhamnose reductase [Acidobacteria bacterium]|nr:dTDP-4-dehydrorhamnose reductase [Acidobacteriota bacterium]